jgi:hypothetical protein
MLGSHALTVFTRGGYSTWGVGKNVGGEAEPMPGHGRGARRALPLP